MSQLPFQKEIGCLLPLARTTSHAASTGDVATAATAATDWAGAGSSDAASTRGDVATAATAATVATDWAGFVPVATPCYLANVANAANASDEKQGEISRISNVSSVSRVAMGVANVALPVVQAQQTQAPDWTPSPPLPDPGMARLLALAACTPMQARGTIATDAQKHHGRRGPIIEGAVAAPVLDSGFFTSMCCAWRARLSILVGRVGTSARVCRFLRPVREPDTVCHLSVAGKAAGFKPVSKEPLVANTLTPKGRIAPTSKATPAISPTEAQAHASLAGFYLRKGNIAQARRKLRQALQALNAMEASHA